jgi:hypothetical protein
MAPPDFHFLSMADHSFGQLRFACLPSVCRFPWRSP